MKLTDILSAATIFAEHDAMRHYESHNRCGLSRARAGEHLVSRDEVLALLKAEIVKLKLEGR